MFLILYLSIISESTSMIHQQLAREISPSRLCWQRWKKKNAPEASTNRVSVLIQKTKSWIQLKTLWVVKVLCKELSESFDMHIRLKILLKTVWAFFLQIFIRLNGVCHVYNVSVSVFGEVNMRKKPLTESCLMHSLRDFQSRTALPQTRLYLRSETIFYFYLHNQLKFTFARCMHQLLHAKRVYGTNCCFQMLYQSFNSFENQQRLDIWICVALKTHSERDFTAIVCHNMSNCIYVDCTTWHSLKPLSLSPEHTKKANNKYFKFFHFIEFSH